MSRYNRYVDLALSRHGGFEDELNAKVQHEKQIERERDEAKASEAYARFQSEHKDGLLDNVYREVKVYAQPPPHVESLIYQPKATSAAATSTIVVGANASLLGRDGGGGGRNSSTTSMFAQERVQSAAVSWTFPSQSPFSEAATNSRSLQQYNNNNNNKNSSNSTGTSIGAAGGDNDGNNGGGGGSPIRHGRRSTTGTYSSNNGGDGSTLYRYANGVLKVHAATNTVAPGEEELSAIRGRIYAEMKEKNEKERHEKRLLLSQFKEPEDSEKNAENAAAATTTTIFRASAIGAATYDDSTASASSASPAPRRRPLAAGDGLPKDPFKDSFLECWDVTKTNPQFPRQML